MKIAYLVQLFPPKWLGGTEVATYNIAKHLAKRKHEIHVITTLDEGLQKESKKERFYLHRIKAPFKIPILGIIFYHVKALLVIKRIDPDVIHAQQISPSGLLALLTKKIFKKNYVVWCQGSDVYLPWKFKTLVSKPVLRNASAVIALTNDMKKRIQEIYDKDIIVVPNGVNLGEFKNLSKKNSRKKLRIKKDENLILFVGGLRPVKGVRYLIEAVNIVGEKIPKTKLLIIGNGIETRSLINLVKRLGLRRHVTFLGKMPHERIPEYMAASDVFVLPSLSEGFPIVTVEAMASGLPIITTNIEGLPEIVEDGKNGFLVEPKNSGAIAEKLSFLLKNKKLMKKISKTNKEKAKRYDWRDVIKKLEKVYSSLM